MRTTTKNQPRFHLECYGTVFGIGKQTRSCYYGMSKATGTALQKIDKAQTGKRPQKPKAEKPTGFQKKTTT